MGLYSLETASAWHIRSISLGSFDQLHHLVWVGVPILSAVVLLLAWGGNMGLGHLGVPWGWVSWGFGAGAAALAWMGYWWLLDAVSLAAACGAAGDACAGGRRLPAWRPHCFRGWSGGGGLGIWGRSASGLGYGWAWGAWVLVGVPPGVWVGACAWARLWCGGLRCIGASAGGRVQ